MKIQKTHTLLVHALGKTEVVIRALSYEEDAQLVELATEKDDQGNPIKDEKGEVKINAEKLLELRSCKMTGIDETDFFELSQPDITTIEHWNHIFTTQDSVTVARLLDIKIGKKPWTVGDDMNPRLLQPLENCDNYVLKYPTGRLTKAMYAQKTDDERTFTITAGCTDFKHDQLYQLAIPDWTYLQNRLTDFLTRPADYFRQQTSKE